jgi:hypothetical protein
VTAGESRLPACRVIAVPRLAASVLLLAHGCTAVHMAMLTKVLPKPRRRPRPLKRNAAGAPPLFLFLFATGRLYLPAQFVMLAPPQCNWSCLQLRLTLAHHLSPLTSPPATAVGLVPSSRHGNPPSPPITTSPWLASSSCSLALYPFVLASSSFHHAHWPICFLVSPQVSPKRHPCCRFAPSSSLWTPAAVSLPSPTQPTGRPKSQ